MLRLYMLLSLPKVLRMMKIMILRLMRLTHGIITLMTYMLKKKLYPVTSPMVTRIQIIGVLL
ncbi:hypothetical protein AHAS_Ahas04G0149300 [Arachis hypogaea]